MTPLRLTNLEPTKGWRMADSWRPLVDMPIRRCTHVLIDHESEDEAIGRGDPDAVRRAITAFEEAKAKTRAKLGWYGWPYPLNAQDEKRLARAFAPLVALADFAAPCCYVNGDGNAPGRAVHWDNCVSSFLGTKPIIAVVSDGMLGRDGACSGEERAEQAEAARICRADGYYVWSGLPDRVRRVAQWLNSPWLNDSSHPDYMTCRRARDELLNRWGFVGSEVSTVPNLLRRFRSASRDILASFAPVMDRAVSE